MRRNKKRHLKVIVMPKMGVFMIVTVVAAALTYLVVDSKCTTLGQEICKYEQAYKMFDNERIREENRWAEKKIPENLDRALLRHGLAMGYPTASQIARVDTRGHLVPGQAVIAKIGRLQGENGEVAGLSK